MTGEEVTHSRSPRGDPINSLEDVNDEDEALASRIGLDFTWEKDFDREKVDSFCSSLIVISERYCAGEKINKLTCKALKFKTLLLVFRKVAYAKYRAILPENR